MAKKKDYKFMVAFSGDLDGHGTTEKQALETFLDESIDQLHKPIVVELWERTKRFKLTQPARPKVEWVEQK